MARFLAKEQSFKVKLLREGTLKGATPEEYDEFRADMEAFQ